nr:hypothetical protein [Tanacetum cinerariifolium]
MAGSDNDSDNASIHNEALNNNQQPNIQPQIITTVSNNNAKFPYLKKDNLKRTVRDNDGGLIFLPLTTAEEHLTVQMESKARTTLLQSIPDDHIADFHYMMQGIYGMQSKLEGLHKVYDRMQKILSQLNQLKAKPDAEEINLWFLRALPSLWSQVALTLKTKGGLEFLSFDDLYYKLKTLEVDIKGYSTFSSSQSAGPSHSAFVSATITNKKMLYGDSLTHSLTTTYFVPSNSKTGSYRTGNVIEDVLQLFVADTEPEQQLAYEDLEQIEKLDLEEMDLKWECMSKRGNDKQRYSSFKIKEIGKKEEDLKALVIVDTLVDWTNHDSKSNGVIAAKEFGMIAGCDSGDALKLGENELGWDDSAFSVFTTNSEDVKG